LGQFGLSHLFYAVVCNEDVIKKKPHPEGLNAAMNRLGKSAAACCYIGDSADDIEMGKRAGVCAVGVLSKYPNSNKLLEAGPDFYFENLSQLLKYILGHWKAGL
jgi:phosphoglycolate phosphatase-like HAD superfamily hydrolase